MNREEIIASLEAEHDGLVLAVFSDARRLMDHQTLGMTFQRVQKQLASWRERYREALKEEPPKPKPVSNGAFSNVRK